MSGILGLGTKLTLGILGLGATAVTGAAVDGAANDGRITKKIAGGLFSGLMGGKTEAGAENALFGISKFMEVIAKLFEVFGGKDNGFSKFLRGKAGEISGGSEKAESAESNPSDSKTNNHENASGMDLSEKVSLGAGVASGIGAVALGAGSRAIPIVGGVVAAVDGIVDVGGFALNGEWKKAGVRTASAVADTVGSSFGFLGFAFGQAAREGIEAGGEAILGKEAHLEDSATVGLVKMAGNALISKTLG